MSAVRLAFSPQSNFVHQVSNGASYLDVELQIPRDLYGRRLYVLLSGGANYRVNAEITFHLNKRELLKLPYVQGNGTSDVTIKLPGGTASAANPQRNNSLQVNFGATATVVQPWELVIGADAVKLSIISSTVVTSAIQFFGLHSMHLW